jgi:Domain of unknown function (DUF3437)/Proteasome-substrate-size regulator, mid region
VPGASVGHGAVVGSGRVPLDLVHCQRSLRLARRFYVDVRNSSECSDVCEAIWRHCVPRLTPHDGSLFRFAPLLCALLPTCDAAAAMTERVYEQWSRFTNVFLIDDAFLSLLARLSTRRPLPLPLHGRFFKDTVRFLEAAVSGTSLPLPDQQEATREVLLLFSDGFFASAEASIAKIAGRMVLAGGEQCASALRHIDALLVMVMPLLHPSNAGSWLRRLVKLVRRLCATVARRCVADALPAESRAAFARIMLPAVRMVLAAKSRHAVLSGTAALKYLAAIDATALFAGDGDDASWLITDVVEALSTLVEPHKAVAALESLAAVAESLLRSKEAARRHVPTLLDLLLPGIDANDATKSMATFKCLFALVGCHLPLRSVSLYADWLSRLFDRLFEYLEPLAHSEHDPVDDAQLFVFQNAFASLFGQLACDELRLVAVRRLVDVVGTRMLDGAIDHYAVLVQSCGAVAPAALLDALVPIVRRALLGDDGGDAIDATMLKESVRWHLVMLGSACYACGGGDVMLRHGNTLRAIVLAALRDERREVAFAACRLLRCILRPLARVYPLDARSLPPDRWRALEQANDDDDGDEMLLGAIDFDSWHSADNVQLRWHVPGAAEVAYARSLFDELRAPLLARWRRGGDGGGGDSELRALTKEAMRRDLMMARALWRAMSTLMPYVDETLDDQTNLAARKSKPHCAYGDDPIWWQPLGGTDGSKLLALSALASARTEFCVALHALCQHVRRWRGDDADTQHALVQTMLCVTTVGGVDADYFESELRMLRMYGVKWRSPHSEARRRGDRTRRFVADRARLHQAALELSAHARATPLYRCRRVLVDDLVALSAASPYSQVRRAAQQALGQLAMRYRVLASPIVLAKLEQLSSVATSKQTLQSDPHVRASVNDAIFTLLSRTFMARIVRSWRHFAAFARAYLSAARHNNAEIQQRLFDSVLLSWARNFGMLPLCHPTTADGGVEAGALVSDEREKAERARAIHRELLDELLALDADGHLHWQYRLALSAFLLTLARASHELVDGAQRNALVAHYCADLQSDVAPLQHFAIEAMRHLIRCCSAPAPTRAHLLNWQLCDACEPSDAEGIAIVPLARHGAIARALGDEALLRRLVATLVADHRQSDRATNGTDDGEDGGSLIGAQLARSLSWHPADWPQSLLPLFGSSDGFLYRNAVFWADVVAMAGGRAAHVALRLAAPLLSSKQKDDVLVGAELVAGCLRGSLRFDSDDDTARLWAHACGELLPNEAWSNVAANLVDPFGDCLRFSLHQVEPRLFGALLERLFGGSALLDEARLKSSALKQTLRLVYAHCTLSELNCRSSIASLDYDALLGHLSSFLAHPYQSVRQQIALMLSVIFFNRSHAQSPIADTPPQRDPVLERFIDAALSRLRDCERLCKSVASSSTAAVATSDDTGDDASGAIDELRKTLSQMRSTLLDFFIESINLGTALVPFLNGHGIVAAVLRARADTDADVVQSAKCGAVLLSLVDLPLSLVDGVLAEVEACSRYPNWQVRAGTLPFLQMFKFVNAFVLDAGAAQAKRIDEVLVCRLSDPSVDVREVASSALSATLRSASPAQLDTWIARFDALALAKVRRFTDEPDEARRAQRVDRRQRRRHAGVLGLAALVSSAPYSLPPWMPRALTLLACHADDAQASIRNTVRDTVREFRRLHADQWQQFKRQFSDAQLDLLSNLFVAPEYIS